MNNPLKRLPVVRSSGTWCRRSVGRLIRTVPSRPPRRARSAIADEIVDRQRARMTDRLLAAEAAHEVPDPGDRPHPIHHRVERSEDQIRLRLPAYAHQLAGRPGLRVHGPHEEGSVLAAGTVEV